jgi:hypothetical protein
MTYAEQLHQAAQRSQPLFYFVYEKSARFLDQQQAQGKTQDQAVKALAAELPTECPSEPSALNALRGSIKQMLEGKQDLILL